MIMLVFKNLRCQRADLYMEPWKGQPHWYSHEIGGDISTKIS